MDRRSLPGMSGRRPLAGPYSSCFGARRRRFERHSLAVWERVFVTSEGHPGARLQRALAAGNLTAAEQAAFEVPFVPLVEARAPDARVLMDMQQDAGENQTLVAKRKPLKPCSWRGRLERVPGTALCQKCNDRKKSGKGKPNYDAMKVASPVRSVRANGDESRASGLRPPQTWRLPCLVYLDP